MKIDKKGQFSCFDGCSSEHYHLDLDHLSDLKMSNNHFLFIFDGSKMHEISRNKEI